MGSPFLQAEGCQGHTLGTLSQYASLVCYPSVQALALLSPSRSASYQSQSLLLTCWTCSSTTRSLASSGDSTSKQSSRSVGETVSRDWDGKNMRWKRFLITCRESSGTGLCEGLLHAQRIVQLFLS